MNRVELTKPEIIKNALDFGAEFVGFAPVCRWEEFKDVPAEFYPGNIWPPAKTVIVLGVPLWLPLVEASPSVLGREQMIVTGELLDEAAYRLANLLNRSGHATVNIPMDGHWKDKPEENTAGLFSDVWAAHYAGLGRVGWNNMLLTREYGPRVNLISVLTSMELEGDPMLEEELCTRCLYCRKICPAQALTGDGGQGYASLDQCACAKNEKRLRKAFRDPCGFCLKVCPVGEDRALFQSNNFKKYFEERETLAKDPNAEEYRDWVHIRSYGSFDLEEEARKD